MPSRCASCALQTSAVNSSSLALRGPSSQGCTNHSTPQTPMVTTGSQNSASSLATMRSQAQASIVFPAGTQVMTGGEMRTVACENHDLDRVVLHRLVERGVKIVGHLQVLRVARLGPVHHDPRDARLRPFHNDGLEFFYCFHG